MDFASLTTVSMSQTLATTPGASYTISFWLGNFETLGTGTTNHFAAFFDGVSFFSNTNMGLQDYGLVTVSRIASGSSTVLSFSGFNVPDSTGLDDVSVVASSVPEPNSLLLLGSGLAGLAGVLRRRLLAR